jgi:hypothetical protein
MSNTKPSPKKEPSMAKNFLFGGISGIIATLVIQPIDMVKVRIQLASESGQAVSPIKITKDYYSKFGIKGFYKGLDSAIIRQACYATTRLGIFYSLIDFFKKQNDNISFFKKSFCSMTAGAIAAMFANPADLILVRMQSDGTLPPEQRRNYKNVGDAFVRVVREEGALSLWRGCGPTAARAVIINWALLAPFEEFKDRLKNTIPDLKKRTIVSSFLASFVGSFISLPFDNIKTKLQKMKVESSTGKYPYDGIIDAFQKSIKNEGVGRLWVGFLTFYVRIGPHVVITLLLNDYFRATFNS